MGRAPVKDRATSNPKGLEDLPFQIPSVSASQRKRAGRIHDALAKKYPDAECALVYSTPHELLIATMLSAQTTDVNVNRATPALFERFPTPDSYAASTPETIEPSVTPVAAKITSLVTISSRL